MALIDCSECGHRVSDKAATCPGCGNPLETIVAIDRLKSTANQQVQLVSLHKSRGIYVMSSLFFGVLGINNFYASQYGRGAFKLIILFICLFLDALVGFHTGFVLLAAILNSLISIIEAIVTTKDGNNQKML